MAATIGELVISLQASTASFSASLKQAQKETTEAVGEIKESIDNLGESFAKLGEFLGLASLSEWVKTSVEYGKQIGTLAQAIGESVEQTSRLAYAAQQADIDIDQLARTMTSLSRALLQAQSGNKKDSAIFSFLGVDDVQNITSASDLLLKLVDGFSQLPANIDRTTVATALFTKTGINVIPFLSQTTEQLKRLMDQSDATGATITSSQAKMSEELSNAYQNLTTGAKAFTLELVNDLAPGLLKSSDDLQTWEERMGGVRDIADKVADAITKIVGAMNELTGKGTPSGIQWLDDLAKKYPKLFGDQSLINLGPSNFQIGDTLPGAPAGTASLFDLSQIDQSRFAPTTKAPGAPDQFNSQLTASQLGSADLFASVYANWDKATDAAGRYKALLDAMNPTHQELQKALDEINAKLEAEIAGMKSSAAAVDLQRLATLGASQATLADIDAKERWASIVQSVRTISSQAATDLNKLNQIFRTVEANNLQAVALQDEIRKINADVANANNPLGPIIGDNAQQQAAVMTEKVNDLTNRLELQLELLEATPDQWLLISNGIQNADAALKQQVLDLAHHVQDVQDAREAWREFGDVAYRSLDDLIVQGKGLKDTLADIGKQIAEMILQWTLFGQSGKGGLFGSIFNSGATSGFLGALSNIFRAGGGPVSANSPYVVGEQGPELFIPSSSGTIAPAGSFGGGPTIIYQIDARGAAPGTDQDILRALQATEDRAVGRAVKAVRESRART